MTDMTTSKDECYQSMHLGKQKKSCSSGRYCITANSNKVMIFTKTYQMVLGLLHKIHAYMGSTPGRLTNTLHTTQVASE